MSGSKISKVGIKDVEHQCRQSLQLYSELVENFLIEGKQKREDCMNAVAKLFESGGKDKPEKDDELITLHLGMVMTTILSAEEALQEGKIDLFISLLTSIALEYGIACTFLDKTIALPRVMQKVAFLRLSNNDGAAKKQAAVLKIKEEVTKNLDKFSQRGATKNFILDMTEKFPELSYKTIEKHVHRAKKLTKLD
jgi:hypothetical protein